MPSPRFIHNLKADSYEAFRQNMSNPTGFLIAPGNAKGNLLVLTRRVINNGVELFTDNGNFEKLSPIGKIFESEAKALKKEVDKFEDRLGRSVRRGALPHDLTARYQALASRVRLVARGAVLDEDLVLRQQEALNPTAVIGAEDLTMAAWLRLDIEPRYIGRERSTYRAYNRSVATRAAKIAASLPTHLVDTYYPVASAVSYNTAKDAGREFAAANLSSISMGFGAYMADNNSSDHMTMNRRRIDFGRNLPQRYTRTIAVAVGFWDGYVEVAGKPPRRFHFLGLGAPIMIPLVTLAGAATSQLSFDATSPILDATKGGTLYTDRPAPLKIRTRKIAYRLAREPTRVWDCLCPFCTAFVARFPFRYDIGHRWFQGHAPTRVEAKDLRPGGALFAAYPLLSEPASGDLRRAINFARVGHNHWIIDRGMMSLDRAAQNGRLETRVRNIIATYQRSTSPQFATAVGLGLKIATRNI